MKVDSWSWLIVLLAYLLSIFIHQKYSGNCIEKIKKGLFGALLERILSYLHMIFIHNKISILPITLRCWRNMIGGCVETWQRYVPLSLAITGRILSLQFSGFRNATEYRGSALKESFPIVNKFKDVFCLRNHDTCR